MKLRTLIVDLDCPFGINHFNLVECDQCVLMVVNETEYDKAWNQQWNKVPDYRQNSTGTGTYSITVAPATTTGDFTWTNVGGTGMTTTSIHAYSNASNVSASLDNMHITLSNASVLEEEDE